MRPEHQERSLTAVRGLHVSPSLARSPLRERVLPKDQQAVNTHPDSIIGWLDSSPILCLHLPRIGNGVPNLQNLVIALLSATMPSSTPWVDGPWPLLETPSATKDIVRITLQ